MDGAARRRGADARHQANCSFGDRTAVDRPGQRMVVSRTRAGVQHDLGLDLHHGGARCRGSVFSRDDRGEHGAAGGAAHREGPKWAGGRAGSNQLAHLVRIAGLAKKRTSGSFDSTMCMLAASRGSAIDARSSVVLFFGEHRPCRQRPFGGQPTCASDAAECPDTQARRRITTRAAIATIHGRVFCIVGRCSCSWEPLGLGGGAEGDRIDGDC